MSQGQYMRVMLYLALSAACLFAGAVIGISRSRALAAHIASLDSKAA